MKFSISILICLFSFAVQGQKLSVLDIDSEVSKIDMDPGLEHYSFDTNDVYNRATDGGGSLEVWLLGKEIRKISQSIFLSNAQFITTVYLKNDQPIMIVETENQYPYDEQRNTFNYAEPETAYEKIIYSWHWEKDAITVRTRGESWGDEQGVDVGSYTSLLATARKILSRDSRQLRGSK
ncbi:hypothetical protein DHB64_08475 [Antarcticibacterium sp. W02-3]|nr:hypothetical protein [Antarcticibacterium sp. W02-3]